MRSHLLFLLFSLLFVTGQVRSSIIHLKLSRRNGRYVRHEPANLTTFTHTLDEIEAKYLRVRRVRDHNQIVRRWKDEDPTQINTEHLFDNVGGIGLWYTLLKVGNPIQTLEFDLDMLSSDFYTTLTTSGLGSKYDTFATNSYEPGDEPNHAICSNPSDLITFPNHPSHLRLNLHTCQAPKSSVYTLFPSGGILGLSPVSSQTRLPGSNLLDQLQTQLDSPLWSITLLDTETGILTLGGTIAREVEAAKIRSQVELEHYGDPIATPQWVDDQVAAQLQLLMPDDSPIDKHFRWISVRRAGGWWAGLMAGVWVNGIKILKNQPIVFDVQSPFILAPAVAAEQFYDAVAGGKRLENGFFAFPCLNPPSIAFEIAGWNFPVMSEAGTRADLLYGPHGSRFSLGELGVGSGYCVGLVVSSEMGTRRQWDDSGMQGVWVLGEPFFRGLGVVFDTEKMRVGVRVY